MRYSWETESYVVETEADTRDRDTPSPSELRLNDDTPSSPWQKGTKRKCKETGAETDRETEEGTFL